VPGENRAPNAELVDLDRMGGLAWVVGGKSLSLHEELLSHGHKQSATQDYQVAAFCPRYFGSVRHASDTLPQRIERLASDWELLMDLREPTMDELEVTGEIGKRAGRWLGERTMGVVSGSGSQFNCRLGDDLPYQWDNREQMDRRPNCLGLQAGVHVNSCRSLSGANATTLPAALL